MPRKSRKNKDLFMDEKQVSIIDNDGSCPSPSKSHILDLRSGHSVFDETCDTNINVAQLEERFRKRTSELERALVEAQQKIKILELNNQSLKPVDKTMTSSGARCKENMPPTVVDEKQVIRTAHTVDLPKVELATFDGNPVTYWKFIKQFDYYVDKKTSDDGEKLLYLLHYCRGRARESIDECIMLPPEEGYHRARKILKELYGQNFHVARSLIDGLLSDVKGTINTAEGLLRLAVKMQNCSITLGQMNYLADLNAVTTLERIVKVLPPSIRFRWAETVDELELMEREPTFDDLTNFIFERARILGNRFGQLAQASVSEAKGPAPGSSNTKSYQAKRSSCVANTKGEFTKLKCRLCTAEHSIQSCPALLELPVKERWNKARQLGLCFSCLRSSHRSSDCLIKTRCGVSNCVGRHHRLLHHDTIESSNPKNDTKTVHSVSKHVSKSVRLGILPVDVETPIGLVRTLAFLDGGSDTTLIRRSFVEKFSMKNTPAVLTVSTLGNIRTIDCLKLKLDLISVDGTEKIGVEEAFTVDELPVKAVKAINQEASKWPHLRDIQFPEFGNQEVNILIGCDVPEAHWSLEQRLGCRKQPYAVKTLLGWVLCGPLNSGVRKEIMVNCLCSEDPTITEHIRNLYDHEFADTTSNAESYSVEERKALAIVEKGIRLDDDHFEIPLPWKGVRSIMPNNFFHVLKRLDYLRRRFLRDEDLYNRYKSVIQRHIAKGYIERSPDNNRTNRELFCWYLPHHPVFNAKKPGKLRVVFDCAAKYMGVSLNDRLLQGPNLTNQLIAVLMRFRKEPVALLADIEDMFLQVRVPKGQRSALRILWWPDDDLSQAPVEYQLTVHPFGAISSPFCANYALKRTATEFGHLFASSVKEAVISNFYVDDYLESLPDTETAKLHYEQLPKLLSMGGFHLTKWLSNKREVLDHIPETERASSVSKTVQMLPSERTLGIRWDAEMDEFIVEFCFPQRPVTRRGILATVSSLYDPLGLVAPWLLPGKLLLQDLCKRKLGWDAPLDKEDESRWIEWIDGLRRIGELRIPRCIKPENFKEDYVELHIFSDASEVGYGSVAYACLCSDKGERHPILLFSKARVAPLKAISIPRLELTAAVLAVRIFQLISASMKMNFKEVLFWTDSMIVLHYINNVSTRFSTFVANRLTIIHDASSPHQWRYVKSCENPADKSSRGVHGNHNFRTWLQGPTFLSKTPESWPLFSTANIHVEGIETKRSAVQLQTSTTMNSLSQLCHRYSNWIKLLKAFAWLHRFKRYWILMNTRQQATSLNVGSLSPDELNLSEVDVIRTVQQDAFPQLFRVLAKSDGQVSINVLKRSGLVKLRPMLVDGTLRVGGRLSNSNLDYETKHPIILPRNHHVTSLIIRHYHEKDGHAGIAHVLASIRQRFWVLHGAATVRNVIGKCMFCRRQNALSSKQLMAPLPPIRVQPGWHPFSQIGLDYFGPIEVKRGRVMEKRYGCILTCLQSRAVHIEMAHSMSTDSFMMLLIRFVGRRGNPTDIYSDNGSNFIGAERELRHWIEGLDQCSLQRNFLVRGINWHFNPPYASHRGGIWERLIRSIRRTLKAVCSEQTLDDEILETALVEVERILNSRPLVPVISDDPNFVSLSPNDLLLLRENYGLQFKQLMTDRYTTRWKRANYLAGVFWKRWVKEYLPTLQLRQKWHFPERNLSQGDVVLVVSDGTPRDTWPIGIITKCFPGSDGLVRTVEVKTRLGLIKRDIRRVCLLEGEEDKDKIERVKVDYDNLAEGMNYEAICSGN